MSDIVLEPVAFDDPELRALVAALTVDLDERYADLDEEAESEPDRTMLNELGADAAPPHGTILLARLDGVAVGCGAVRRHGEDTAEIKRMYVAPEARGQGIARTLLTALETAAADLGYRRLVLETGTRQQEAMALYESAGWTPMAPYGAYRSSAWSRCFERSLDAAPGSA